MWTDCELCGSERTRTGLGKNCNRLVSNGLAMPYKFWRAAADRYEQVDGGILNTDCLYFRAEDWLYDPLTRRGTVSLRKRSPTLVAGIMLFGDDVEYTGVKTYLEASETLRSYGPLIPYPDDTENVRFWDAIERQLADAPQALFEQFGWSSQAYRSVLKTLSAWSSV